MVELLELLYLGALGLTSVLSFWDAPLRLVRAHREGAITRSRRYHVLNAVSLALLAGWLAVLWLGWDAPLLGPLGALGPVARWTGLLLAWIGSSYAGWARLTIREGFVPTSAVRHDHRVVREGPYAQVRHPFYIGMGVAVLAGALTLDSLVTGIVGILVAVLMRELAVLEEEHLSQVLGGAYRAYARDVPRFIPGARPGPVGSP